MIKRTVELTFSITLHLKKSGMSDLQRYLSNHYLVQNKKDIAVFLSKMFKL